MCCSIWIIYCHFILVCRIIILFFRDILVFILELLIHDLLVSLIRDITVSADVRIIIIRVEIILITAIFTWLFLGNGCLDNFPMIWLLLLLLLNVFLTLLKGWWGFQCFLHFLLFDNRLRLLTLTLTEIKATLTPLFNSLYFIARIASPFRLLSLFKFPFHLLFINLNGSDSHHDEILWFLLGRNYLLNRHRIFDVKELFCRMLG